MEKFNFIQTKDEESMGRNWEHLNGKVACQEYNPFYYDTPAAGGIDGVTSYHGVYGVFGPIVYFSVSLFGTAIEWGNGATISLPIAVAMRAANEPQQYGLVFPVRDQNGFIDNGFGALHTWGANNGTTIFATFATVGGTTYDSLNVSGWYFR